MWRDKGASICFAFSLSFLLSFLLGAWQVGFLGVLGVRRRAELPPRSGHQDQPQENADELAMPCKCPLKTAPLCCRRSSSCPVVRCASSRAPPQGWVPRLHGDWQRPGHLADAAAFPFETPYSLDVAHEV